MSSQIDDYVKRPIRYRNIDGLNELGWGIMWIAFPLLIFLHKTARSGSFWHHYMAFFGGVVALTFILLYGQKALKKRITYPRTGYVKYRQTGKRFFAGRGLVVGGAAAIAIAIAVVLVLRRMQPHSSRMVGPALGAVTMGLFYVFITQMDAVWRWVVLVALIVAPPVVAMLPLGQLWLGNLPVVLMGMIYFVSGTITLALYLRQNPVPEQAAE